MTPKKRRTDWKGAKLEAVNGRWTEWQYPSHRGYRMACCDCGLVHEMEFKVTTKPVTHPATGRVLRRKQGSVAMRVARDNRTTAALRRADPADEKGMSFLRLARRALVELYAEFPKDLPRFQRVFEQEVRRAVRRKAKEPTK